MARPPCGKEVLFRAQQQLGEASDANELRILQSGVLPLAHGFSTQETAAVVGRSPRWVTTARNAYIRCLGIARKETKKIRNNAHLSMEEEMEFLAPFLENARCGSVLVVNDIHRAVEEQLGHKVALATAYNLLHRHGCASSLQTNAMLPPTYRHKKIGKKLPERLAQIEKEWEQPGPLRLMFQDEARFGRIAASRRC